MKNFHKPLGTWKAFVEMVLVDSSILKGTIVVVGLSARLSDALKKLDQFVVLSDEHNNHHIINVGHIIKVVEISVPGQKDSLVRNRNFNIPLQMQRISVEITLINSATLKGRLVVIGLSTRLSDTLKKPDKFIVLSDSQNNHHIINKQHIIKVVEI